MKFHRERLFNTPEDCEALRAEHVPEAPSFGAYTFYGEDLHHPMRLDLYAPQKPAHDTFPIAVYDRIEDDLVLRPKEERIKRIRAAVGAAALPESIPAPTVQKTMVYKEAA